jgi:hypothetical protein
MEANPDIISFKDVISCVTDIDERQEEVKRRTDDGQMVSYNPPRFKHHYNFYIDMEIRNNPYFSSIRFCINSGVITLETVGSRGGLFSARDSIATIAGNVFGNSLEQKRYREYEQMCDKIKQAVEDGKRGGQNNAQPSPLPQQPVSIPGEQSVPKFCSGCGAKYTGERICPFCDTPF